MPWVERAEYCKEALKYLLLQVEVEGIVQRRKPANVLVIGGGVVGQQAALMAAGMNANVTIFDVSLPRMRYLSEIMPKNVDTLMSSKYNIEALLPAADLIIGAVLIPRQSLT